jgi:prevent-host-death family protein
VGVIQLTAAQARQHFADALDRAGEQPVVIERRGKAVAVLVDAAQFARMREALEESEDAAAFDAAVAEDGPNLPWEQAKADLGWA